MQLLGGTQYNGWSAITPSDTTLINCRGIYVGGAGAVTVSIDSSAASVTFAAVPVGTILPVALDGGRVMAATTATLLLALY